MPIIRIVTFVTCAISALVTPSLANEAPNTFKNINYDIPAEWKHTAHESMKTQSVNLSLSRDINGDKGSSKIEIRAKSEVAYPNPAKGAFESALMSVERKGKNCRGGGTVVFNQDHKVAGTTVHFLSYQCTGEGNKRWNMYYEIQSFFEYDDVSYEIRYLARSDDKNISPHSLKQAFRKDWQAFANSLQICRQNGGGCIQGSNLVHF